MITTVTDTIDSVAQVPVSPAIEAERSKLEQRALAELRRWGRMDVFHRVLDFGLERATQELLAFEERHCLNRH